MKQKAMIFIGIILLVVTTSFAPSEKSLTDVSLLNIEALYSTNSKPVACFGYGTIDCDGNKVEMKISY